MHLLFKPSDCIDLCECVCLCVYASLVSRPTLFLSFGLSWHTTWNQKSTKTGSPVVIHHVNDISRHREQSPLAVQQVLYQFLPSWPGLSASLPVQTLDAVDNSTWPVFSGWAPPTRRDFYDEQ